MSSSGKAAGGGATAFPNFAGNGSPEGVQTAAVGKSYVDTTNGALYFKLTGSGNTGWAIAGGLGTDYATTGIQGAGIDAGGAANLLSLPGHTTSIGDTNTDAGIGNGLFFHSNVTDGLQFLVLQVGSSGQFLTTFKADGSTVLPGSLVGPIGVFPIVAGTHGYVIISDVDGLAGTGNGILFNPSQAADGAQLIRFYLGSSGQYTWEFGTAGQSTFPGPIVTAPTDSHTATAAFGALAVGTPKQNLLGYDVLVSGIIKITASTNGTLALGVGPSATPTTDPLLGAFTTAAVSLVPYSAVVPNNYYLSVVSGGTVTLGAVTAIATPL